MTTKTLVGTSAAIEIATGIALVASPAVVAGVLLGASLSGAGAAVGRVGGFGLLSLGLACWPNRVGATSRAIGALTTYNLLAALYLGYLTIGGFFASRFLWFAFLLHAVLAVLLARPAMKELRRPSEQAIDV